MSVHYKFKSTLDFDTITFDGLHISVADLKKSIIQQKRLGKTVDFDLQITNAQTKEEYNDDSMLIPKNTSLTIARVPVKAQGKKNWEKPAVAAEPTMQMSVSRSKHDAASSQTNVDLSMMNGSEEDKIREMMFQSTADYDPTNYQKVRGSQTGEVPMNYKCYRCHKPGHWIKNCPMGPLPKENVEIKRTSGIPRSFIERDKDVENNPAMQPVQMPPEEKQVIPEDLICSICKDLFTDAVMIPCCGSSFCDECVRTALLESEDNECPDCKEKGSSPGSLIPNRFLRNSVNAFRNETGYIKSIQRVGKKQVKPEETPTADSTTNSGMAASVGSGTVSSTAIGPISTTTELVESSTFEDEGGRAPDSNLQPHLFDEISQQDDMASPAVEDKESMMPPGASGPFDNESDYEDNITVTVPPAHLQSRGAFRGHYNGGRPGMRHGGGKPHGLDTPPNERQLMGAQVYGGVGSGGGGGGGGGNGNNGNNGGRGGNEPVDREEDHRRMMAMEEKDGDNYGTMVASNERVREYDGRSPEYLHSTGGRGLIPIPHNHPQQHVLPIGTSMGHPGVVGGAYMGPGNAYPAHGHGGHPHYGGGMGGGYGGMQPGGGGYPPQQRPYDHHGGMYPGERPPRMMYPHQRGGFAPHHPHMRPRHMGPGPMSAYPGIHQTIGPGIIDDPLEAFNRIMREKERRKEQEQQQMARRNRSPLGERGRRSRSFDNGGGRGGGDGSRGRGGGPGRGASPDRRRNSRQRSTDRRRSPDDKHPDERDRPRERRRNRSSSYSSGSSRSYSRSKSRSPMKRNKSPRKRSRSPGYRERRSRSRSGSFGAGRLRDRRDDRRDDRRAGDFRDRSPGFNQQYGSYGHRLPRGGGGGPRGGGRIRGNSRDHGGMNAGGMQQHYPPRGYDRHQPGAGGGYGHMHPMGHAGGGGGGGRVDGGPPYIHGQNMNDYHREGPSAHQSHGGMQTGASASGQPNRYPGRDDPERSYGGAHQEHYYDGEAEHHMQHQHQQQQHHAKGGERHHHRGSRESSQSAPHQREDARFESRQHDVKEGEWPEHSEGGSYQQHSPKRHDNPEHGQRRSPDTKEVGGSVREGADLGKSGGVSAVSADHHHPPSANHGRSRSRDRQRSMVASESGGDRDNSERRRNRSKHSKSPERREKSTTSSRGQRSAGDNEKDRHDRRPQAHPSDSGKDKRGNLSEQQRRGGDERDHHHRDRDRERERDRERDRDRERERDRERDRDREREKEKDKTKEKDRDRDRNPEHEQRDRERARERDREKDKEREKDREKEREREKEKDRERHRDKDRDAKEVSKKKARDSSDDERRDRKKERDKKKRKKEKEVEKRKHKKERKEKDRERRSKDRRKDRKTVEKEEPDSSQQPSTPTAREREEAAQAGPGTEQERENRERQPGVNSTAEEDETDRPQTATASERRNDGDDDDDDDDDGVGDKSKHSDTGSSDEDEDAPKEQQQEAQIDGHDHADLYSDIPDKYEEDQLERSILLDDNAGDNQLHPKTAEDEDAGAGLVDSTEGGQDEKPDCDGDILLKRSDSVLDLHANLDFEEQEELEEGEQLSPPPRTKTTTSDSAFIPEPSKWELDEEGQIHSTMEKREFDPDGDFEGVSATPEGSETMTAGGATNGAGKVTSEVLKRAENAIFTRAINAIRPIEIKKISVERQKLYTIAGGRSSGSSSDLQRDMSSPTGMDQKLTPEHDELKRVQVTVPVNDDRVERSVEIKHKVDLKLDGHASPMRTSVRDRLGSKVSDSTATQYNRSRTPPPGRKGSGGGLSSVAATGNNQSSTGASGTGNSNRNKSASDRRRGSSRSRSRPREDNTDNRKRTEGGDRATGRHTGGGGGGNRQQPESSRRGATSDRTGNTGNSNNDRQQRNRKDAGRRDSRERSENRRADHQQQQLQQQQQQQQQQRGRSRDRVREQQRDRPNARRGSRERKGSVSPPASNRGMDKRKEKQQQPPSHAREASGSRVSTNKPSQREDSSSNRKVRQGDEKNTAAPSSTTSGPPTTRSEKSPERDEQRMARKRSADHLRDVSGDPQHRPDEATRDSLPGATGNSSSNKRSKIEKSSKTGKSGGGSSSESSSSDSDSSSSDSSADSDGGAGKDGGPSASTQARSSSKKRKKRKHKKDRKRAKRSASTDSDYDSGSKRKKSKKKSSKSSKKKKKSSKHKKD